MKSTFAFLFLITSLVGFGQDGNDKTIYLDSIGRPVPQDKAFAYRIVEGYYLTKEEYHFKNFYSSGKLKSEGNSVNREYMRESGLFTFYYENGQKQKTVVYDKPQALNESSVENGPFASWYENGKEKTTGEYIRKKKDDKSFSVLKVNRFSTEDGQLIADNGEGFYEDNSFECHSVGKIANGFKDGIWTGKSNKYHFSFSEEYKNGELVNGTATNGANQNFQYTSIQVNGEPKGGMMDFYRYVQRNFKIPEDEELRGKILIDFNVSATGAIQNVSIYQGLSPNADAEAVRLMQDYKNMQPSKLRGIPISTLYHMPISIQSGG